jgi:acetyl-CoA C-acetyltransferase
VLLKTRIASRVRQRARRDPVPILRRTPKGDAMTEAFVYDAIRTPRGKGKKDGSLHEGQAGEPAGRRAGRTAAAATTSIPGQVDDVVMGVVSPIGEQGSVIAKVAASRPGWDWRCSGVQLNRSAPRAWRP